MRHRACTREGGGLRRASDQSLRDRAARGSPQELPPRRDPTQLSRARCAGSATRAHGRIRHSSLPWNAPPCGPPQAARFFCRLDGATTLSVSDRRPVATDIVVGGVSPGCTRPVRRVSLSTFLSNRGSAFPQVCRSSAIVAKNSRTSDAIVRFTPLLFDASVQNKNPARRARPGFFHTVHVQSSHRRKEEP